MLSILALAILGLGPQAGDREAKPVEQVEQRVLHEAGPRETCVDVLFVGDGYVAEDLEPGGGYWKDVERAVGRLQAASPFAACWDFVNVAALKLESPEAGCDRTSTADRVDTALDSTFDHRNKQMLRFRAHERLVRLVRGAGGADLVFVLVNSKRTGGGNTAIFMPTEPVSILPAPTFSAADEVSFQVALHSLGHSLVGLNDEFVKGLPPLYCEHPDGGLPPGGANIESRDAIMSPDFLSLRQTIKWKHFLELPDADEHDWLHEGAGQREDDYYRPWRNCLMREVRATFCPVCAEEMVRALHRLAGREWDDGRYHADHPLTLWKD